MPSPGRIKASDVMAIKIIVQNMGDEMETMLLQRLTPEAVRIYEEAVATKWIPQKEESEIFCAAAEVLFPGMKEGIYELGRLIAHHNMMFIYKAFLRIPTVEFIIGQVPRLWRMNLEKGKATVEKTSEKTGILRVRDYPELLRTQGEEIAGYICGILEMTKARHPHVTFQDSNPAQWEWHIQCE